MANDRDDSKRGHSLAQGPSAETPLDFEARDQELFLHVIAVVGARLMEAGLTSPQIHALFKASYKQYEELRGEIDEPEAFLVRQIEERARWHMKLRGIAPPPVPGEPQSPDPLELIYSRKAYELLSPDSRIAVCLVFWHDKSLEDTAAEMDKTVRYVKRILSEAMDRLRKWSPQRPRE